MALSDIQLMVLSAACRRRDRAVYLLTAKLPGRASAKVVGSLLNKALIREVQARREDRLARRQEARSADAAGHAGRQQ